MPGLDHRGPQGEGPMTGRKAGKCTNFGAGRAGKAGQGEVNTTDKEENVPVTGGRGAGQGPRHGKGRGQGQGSGRGAGRGNSEGSGGASRGAGQNAGRGAGSGRGRGR